MELDIRSERLDGDSVLSVSGEIDVYTSPQLKTALIEAAGDGGTVVVDMHKVGFIDSSGLGVLVSALRRAREREGTVRIVCTRESILKIFRITGLDKVFPIFSDVAEAREF